MSGVPASTARVRATTAIFSKRPEAGRVKTRLCPPLVPAEAARLAEAMLRDAVERCAAAPGFRTVLCYAPAAAGAWFRAAFPAVADQRAQRGAGLAERLAAFFADELGVPGAGRTAVVIGSDAPLVGTRRIARAHALLARGADLVLGPDAGGGYYLVGLRAPHPELFTAVPMSTADMYARTVDLARSSGLVVEELAPGYDVDVADDLDRLRRDLRGRAAGDDEFPRHTAEAIERIEATRV